MLILLTEPLVAARAAVPADVLFRARRSRAVASSPRCPASRCSRASAAAIVGLMIATIGTDPMSGVSRFTFGSPDLLEGIAPIFVMVGLFAITELMTRSGVSAASRSPAPSRSACGCRSFPMMRKIARAQAVGCVVGTFEGLMPGAGGSIAAFISYNEAKRWSKEPEKFGKGSEEGVAAPETANNTVRQHGADPAAELRHSRLELRRRAARRPADPRAAAGAAAVRGERRGRDRPLCRLVRGRHRADRGRNADPARLHVAREPAAALSRRPSSCALVMSGVYTVHMSLFDVGIVLAAGLLGYFMRHFGFPFLPAVLGVVLGELVESNYRRSLVLSGGDSRSSSRIPIAIGFLVHRGPDRACLPCSANGAPSSEGAEGAQPRDRLPQRSWRISPPQLDCRQAAAEDTRDRASADARRRRAVRRRARQRLCRSRRARARIAKASRTAIGHAAPSAL